MAKKNLAPLAQGAHLQDGSFKHSMTALELLALAPTGVATSGGIILANVNQKFSLMYPTTGADGKPTGELPVNYQISISIRRDPIPGDETERAWMIGDESIKATESMAVKLAADASKANAKQRKLDDALDRQKAIKAAQDMTRDMMREGMAMNPQQSPVALLKQIAEVAPVLKGLKDAL